MKELSLKKRIKDRNKDIINIEKYEKLLSNSQIACYQYNEYAWNLSGQDLNSSGSDLEIGPLVPTGNCIGPR